MKNYTSFKQETTTIEATKDLFNAGQCFTKGVQYEVQKVVKTESGLMEATVINDMGQPHTIGSWWREFKIIDES